MKILLEAYSAISPLEDIYDLVSKSNILYRLDGIYTIIGNQSKRELIDVNNIDGDKFRDIMWNKDMKVAEKIDALFDDEKHKDSIDIEDPRAKPYKFRGNYIQNCQIRDIDKKIFRAEDTRK